MKTRNKALLLSLCAVLLVATSVFGTMAYLTSEDSVTNTFTVGKVTFGDGDLEEGLDEAKVNLDGDTVNSEGEKVEISEAPRVDANTYKLVPGHTYTKDPTVHINNESEACYIFVKVENGISDIEVATEADEETIEEQIVNYGWTELEGEGVYWKLWESPIETEGDKNPNTTDLTIFDSFTVSGDVEAMALETYADAEIVVTAYAIQADGFEDNASGAWAAVQGE